MAKRKSPAPERSDKARRFRIAMLVAIPVLAGILFGQTLNYEFTNWDDNVLIKDNPQVVSGDIVDIFTPRVGKTYQPVRVLSYAIDHAIWGFNPVAFHAVNILFHALAAIMLYLFLAAFFSDVRNGYVAAGVAALLFLVHPVNVESVTWMASRKYVLLAFFSFVACYCHLRAEKERTWQWEGLAAMATLGAILASPFGVVMPALILLMDYARAKELNPLPMLKAHWGRYLPHGAMGLGFTILLVTVLTRGDGAVSREHQGDSVVYTAFTVLRVMFDYARNLICPIWLNNRYFHEIAKSLFEPKVLSALAGLAILGWWVIRELCKANKMPLFCAGWFFIAWAPVSNIIIPISTIMADRYLYLAAVGIFAGLGLLAAKLADKKLAILLLPLLILGGLTMQRNKVWANSRALWEDSIRKDDRTAVAHNNLGLVDDAEGNIPVALERYTAAVERNPHYPEAHYNLGRAMVLLNASAKDPAKYTTALTHMDSAIANKPGFADAHNYRGIVLRQLDRQDEARTAYEAALELAAGHSEAHVNLGNLHYLAGNMEGALMSYRNALHYSPGLHSIHHNVGAILLSLPLTEASKAEARTHLQRAVAIEPDRADSAKLLKMLDAQSD
jgi:tetratricopeptide (TPR) repeat protein